MFTVTQTSRSGVSPSCQLSVFWAVKFKEEVKGTNEQRRVSWPFLWLIVSELGRCVYLSVTEQVDVLMVRTEHHVSQDRLPLHHSHRLIQQSVIGRRRDPIHADLKRTQKEWRSLKKSTCKNNKKRWQTGKSLRKEQTETFIFNFQRKLSQNLRKDLLH